MNLKNLIFINNEKENGDSQRKNSSFPSTAPAHKPSTTSVVVPSQATEEVCQADIDKVLAIYEKGFDGINKPGYDFYEFFKAILATGSNDASIYKMAFSMAQSQDKSVSKTSLIEDANEYLEKLTETHANNESRGNTNLSNVETEKAAERQTLKGRQKTLMAQMENLQTELNSVNADLSGIDSRYQARITDVKCKLMANDHAKTTIFTRINTVVNGIKDNL